MTYKLRNNLTDYFDDWFGHAEALLAETDVQDAKAFMTCLESIGETYIEMGEVLKDIHMTVAMGRGRLSIVEPYNQPLPFEEEE